MTGFVRLSGQDSAKFLKFKRGDKVRVKSTEISGTVVDGDCYPDFGCMAIYIIKVPGGTTHTYVENEFELVPEEKIQSPQ